MDLENRAGQRGLGGVADAAGDGATFGMLGGVAAGIDSGVVAGAGNAAQNNGREIVMTSPKNLIPTQTKSEMSGSQIKRLTKDMKENGYDQSKPISAQPNERGRLEITDGHHRREAAIKAGVEKVPVEVTKQ